MFECLLNYDSLVYFKLLQKFLNVIINIAKLCQLQKVTAHRAVLVIPLVEGNDNKWQDITKNLILQMMSLGR